MTPTRFFAVIMAWLVPLTVLANDWVDMYSGAIEQHQPRLERRINELYVKGFQPFLATAEAHRLARVAIEVPRVGEVAKDPTDFYSITGGNSPTVVMPALSLMFLEDLCTAYAWLWANDYSLETIDEYVAMLRYRKPGDFPGGRYPAPLKALGIPSDALEDKRVNDMSLRFRNTAWAFILGHELGHVVDASQGYDHRSSAESRRSESRADTQSLDWLQRTDTLPMGAVLYFQAQAYMMPSQGQLKAEGVIKNEADWQRYLSEKITHPLTSDRLENMAAYLVNRWRGKERETARYIGGQLYQIADILSITDLHGCMAVVASRIDIADLRPRRARQSTGDLMTRWCQTHNNNEP
jgi:hypothetical protein